MTSCLRKEPLSAENEDRLVSINVKILEIKKKMQLLEGQRKSHHEENEAEKNLNNEKIESLKKEIKARSQELAILKTATAEERVQGKKNSGELPPIVCKTSDKVLENLDLKVIEQRKQLDVLRYEKRKKKNFLRSLEKEYEQLLIETSKTGLEKIGEVDSVKKHIAHLENEIHQVDVQLNEAELVKKKYAAIKQELTCDAVKFESAIGNIQETIDKQDAEIKKLQTVNAEAVEMRTRALTALSMEQAEESEANEMRRREVNYYNDKFKERRTELEVLEKKIFPVTVRPAIHPDSEEDDVKDKEVVQEKEPARVMEEAVEKLIKAIGVMKPQEVIDRFRSQKEASDRLRELRKTTEEEKSRLEAAHSSLVAQLEAYKYADSTDDTISQERIKCLKEQIQKVEAKKKEQSERLEEKNSLLMDMKRTFYDFCGIMDWTNIPPLPSWTSEPRDVMDLLTTAIRRYQASKEHARSLGDIPEIVINMRDKLSSARTAKSQGLRSDDEPSVSKENAMTYREFMQMERPKSSYSSDEEEEIPTRSFLKRQAQVIVDTKSRRRGGRMPYQKK